MVHELKIPQSGESIQEVQIGQWLKEEGQWVERDETVVELETDKASLDLPAPVAGVLKKILKQNGEDAEIDEVIALIDDEAQAGPADAKDQPADAKDQPAEAKNQPAEAKNQPADAKDQPAEAKDQPAEAKDQPAEAKDQPAEAKDQPAEAKDQPAEAKDQPAEAKDQPAEAKDQPAEAKDQPAELEEDGKLPDPMVIMPAAQRLLREHNLQARDVPATGPGGRLLKEDVLRYVESSQTASSESPVPPAEAKPASEAAEPPPVPSKPSAQALNATDAAPRVTAADDGAGRQEEAVPMSLIRRRIASRLVEAQHEAALLTTFNEVDMTEVMALRRRYREPFMEKYGIKLGFMSFFVKAVIESLKESPAINAEIRDRTIVYRNYYDVGIAIGGGKGLVVPVLRNAERLSFAEIEQHIADFAQRAADNKIRPDELAGGTFTITNGGVYGSLLSTPIVNPPQSGVLGLHTIQERPVARDGQVVIRPMMYLALTYDHRVVDGREAVTFLKRLQGIIEEPARMLLEV